VLTKNGAHILWVVGSSLILQLAQSLGSGQDGRADNLLR
jgi:hypothetical protein